MAKPARFSATVPAILAAAMAGCAARGPVVMPEPELVTRHVYVRVDAALTSAEPIAEPHSPKVREALRVNSERKAALERANAKLACIAALEGLAVDDEPPCYRQLTEPKAQGESAWLPAVPGGIPASLTPSRGTATWHPNR
jgi:predicted small lipoprotein YifL